MSTIPAAFLVISTRTGNVESRHRTEASATKAAYRTHPSGEGFAIRYGRIPTGGAVAADDERIIL